MIILHCRYYSDEINSLEAEPESSSMSREVRGLPDVLGMEMLLLH